MMRGLRRGAIATAVLLFIGGSAVQACQGKKVLFEDDFTDLRPTWGTATDDVKIADGKLVLSTKAGKWLMLPNTESVYDDIDMCADVTTIAAIDPLSNYVGLIFWEGDSRNFYTFEIAANGKASVWRQQRGRWLSQVPWTAVPSLHGGDGTTNQLRIVTSGNTAALYINGEKFKDLKGQPPQDGQEIGVIAFSPEKGVATYGFDNLKITEPEKTSAK